MSYRFFLSHASYDEVYARRLANHIEKVVEGTKVFCSSRSHDIPSAKLWQEQVLTGLNEATHLIVLLTSNSINRFWVGFEVGFFWHKMVNPPNIEIPRNIHVLRFSDVDVPHPLSNVQAKSIDALADMTNFFTQLLPAYNHKNDDELVSLVQLANEMHLAADRSPQEIFLDLLEQSAWEHNKDLYRNYDTFYAVNDARYKLKIRLHRGESEMPSLRWLENHAGKLLTEPPRISSVQLTVDEMVIDYCFVFTIEPSDIDNGYFVPAPSFEIDEDGNGIFYWSSESLCVKVVDVISQFYVYSNGYRELSKIMGIPIRDSDSK